MILFLSCETVSHKTTPPEDYIIDSVEEHDFSSAGDEKDEDTPVHKGSAFVITVSSDNYEIKQNRYFGVLRVSTEAGRRKRMMSRLSRYDRKDITRTARLLIKISPNSGKMTAYRLVNSSYVRELDSLIMNDIPHIRFRPVGGRVPSVIYVSYVIHIRDKR